MKGLIVFRCLMSFITGEVQPQVLSHFRAMVACCSCFKYSPPENPFIFTPTGQPALCFVSATRRGGETDFNLNLIIRNGPCRSASVLTHTSPRQFSTSPGDWVGNLAAMRLKRAWCRLSIQHTHKHTKKPEFLRSSSEKVALTLKRP